MGDHYENHDKTPRFSLHTRGNGITCLQRAGGHRSGAHSKEPHHAGVHLTGTGDLGNTYVLNQRSTFQFNIRTVDAILVSQGAAPNQDVSVFFDSDVPIRITSTNCTPTP